MVALRAIIYAHMIRNVKTVVDVVVLTSHRFDPDTDEWCLVEPMTTRRIGVGVVTVNRLMYAIGGYDGVNRLRSVEVYYPETNDWRHVAPMNATRSGAGSRRSQCYSC